MVMGRPTAATPGIIEEIAERLSRGEPLARICDLEHMPSYSTVRRWEAENADFQAISARAKIDGTHFMADDCLRIADDPEIEPADKRIRVDTRLRLIGKWNAKQYGEATLLKHADADGSKLDLATALAKRRQRVAEGRDGDEG